MSSVVHPNTLYTAQTKVEHSIDGGTEKTERDLKDHLIGHLQLTEETEPPRKGFMETNIQSRQMVDL